MLSDRQYTSFEPFTTKTMPSGAQSGHGFTSGGAGAALLHRERAITQLSEKSCFKEMSSDLASQRCVFEECYPPNRLRQPGGEDTSQKT
jgi:hypothetical protein